VHSIIAGGPEELVAAVFSNLDWMSREKREQKEEEVAGMVHALTQKVLCVG
jgi:hypothetical protein